MKKLTAYKAFDSDWTCRGFQYEIGKTYKHNGDVEMCKAGFHACTNPLDVLDYYNLCDSKFAEVELSQPVKKHGDDSKVASAEITIKAELGLPAFIKSAAEAITAEAKKSRKKQNTAATGNSAQLAASGYYAQLAASGDSAQLAASGDSAQLAASGGNSVIASASYEARAKGPKGTWVSLAEFNDDNECVGFATGCVGKKLADTWLIAKDGKLVAETDG